MQKRTMPKTCSCLCHDKSHFRMLKKPCDDCVSHHAANSMSIKVPIRDRSRRRLPVHLNANLRLSRFNLSRSTNSLGISAMVTSEFKIPRSVLKYSWGTNELVYSPELSLNINSVTRNDSLADTCVICLEPLSLLPMLGRPNIERYFQCGHRIHARCDNYNMLDKCPICKNWRDHTKQIQEEVWGGDSEFDIMGAVNDLIAEQQQSPQALANQQMNEIMEMNLTRRVTENILGMFMPSIIPISDNRRDSLIGVPLNSLVYQFNRKSIIGYVARNSRKYEVLFTNCFRHQGTALLDPIRLNVFIVHSEAFLNLQKMITAVVPQDQSNDASISFGADDLYSIPRSEFLGLAIWSVNIESLLETCDIDFSLMVSQQMRIALERYFEFNKAITLPAFKQLSSLYTSETDNGVEDTTLYDSFVNGQANVVNTLKSFINLECRLKEDPSTKTIRGVVDSEHVNESSCRGLWKLLEKPPLN